MSLPGRSAATLARSTLMWSMWSRYQDAVSAQPAVTDRDLRFTPAEVRAPAGGGVWHWGSVWWLK